MVLVTPFNFDADPTLWPFSTDFFAATFRFTGVALLIGEAALLAGDETLLAGDATLLAGEAALLAGDAFLLVGDATGFEGAPKSSFMSCRKNKYSC
jgi:hypothetical protein